MADTIETRQLEVLVHVTQLIATLDLDEVLLHTLARMTEVVGASEASFFLINENKNTVERFIAARDMDPQKKSAVSRSVLEHGLAGWVLSHGEGALVSDTMEDSRWLMLDDRERVRSALCVPFFIEGKVRGVMTLEHPEPDHFTNEDLRLAKAVASQAGFALHNAELFDRVQTQERQLEAVMDSISEALIAVDHAWCIRLLNNAAETLLGVTADGAVGKTLDKVSENVLFAKLTDTIAQANLTSGTKTFELRDEVTHKDYVVNVAVLHQDSLVEVGYAIALYDVTSLKDLNRLKTHMIKMASHDLKSPLGVLLGYVDLVWGDVSTSVVPQPSYIEAIYKAITRMETLIASLLDAHKAEDDSFVTVAIDPYELFQSSLEDVTPAAEQHHHEIIKNIQTNLHPIKGDFVQLREAMSNLLNNAVKYTPDGGTITINIYIEEDRFFFSVKDTGYGIPADQQSHIFESYFRANSEATSHIEGTGVGLSLVKEVIDRHGGHVWFESQEGHGSKFGFWLPMLDKQVPVTSA